MTKQRPPAPMVLGVLSYGMKMVVPHDALQPETLRALIEEFVTRDGAVHGHRETSAQEMAEAVMRQLKCGTVVIVFDEASETCTVVTKDSLPKGESGVRRIVEE